MEHVHPADPARGALRFLLALDASVKDDAMDPGFRGCLAIGVTDTSGEVWWNARFDAGADTSIDDEPSADATALMAVSPDDAVAILQRGRLSAENSDPRFEGDAALLERFLERYLRSRSVVGVRVAQSRGAR